MPKEANWVGLMLALLLVGIACAGELPRVRPEEVGLSAKRLDDMDKFYADKVNKGEMAGIVTLVARHGKVAHFSAIGYANVDSKQRMSTDTLFRWYSMTKPITATALMMLYEEGRFQMNDPVSKYIPEFANLRVLREPDAALDDNVPVEHAATVQDLFRHTAGFTHGLGTDRFDEQYAKANVFGLDVSLSEMMSSLAKIPLRYQPGSRWAYSVAPDVQARLVEVISGVPFDKFLRQRIFNPLGMKDTGFWLSADRAARLAAVHWTKNGKLVTWDDANGHPDAFGRTPAEPWLSINNVTRDRKHKGGSFGLIGTAEDYWRFAQMILNGGALVGTRVLSPQIVHYMTRDQLGSIDRSMLFSAIEKGAGFGLGFGVVLDPTAAGFLNSEGSIFWDGAAATLWWADPKEDLVVVAMTQYLDSSGPNLQVLRPQLRALVYAALTE